MSNRQGEWIKVDGVEMFIVGQCSQNSDRPGWYECAEPIERKDGLSICPTCSQIIPRPPPFQYRYHLIPPEKAQEVIPRPSKWRVT